MIVYVFWIHQGFIKATKLLILTWLFETYMVARQQQNLRNSLILSLKFYFEMNNELL